MTRPRKWSDADRERAVELYRTQGLAAATRQTGIPKGTIGQWAKQAEEAGTLDRAAVREHTRTKTDAAVEARAEALELERLDVSEALLRRLSAKATALLARRLEDAEAEEELIASARQQWSDALSAVRQASQFGEEERAKALKAARQAELGYRLASSGRLEVRELVGIVTRSIHDHLLLEGLGGDDAPAGDILLEFPVPTAADPAGARAAIRTVEEIAAAGEGPAAGRPS